MSYNERLAEIMMRKDDKTYRETAEVIRKCPLNIYAFYQAHKRPPRLLDPNYNIKSMKKSLEQLERELSVENLNERTDLSSFLLAQIVSSNLV